MIAGGHRASKQAFRRIRRMARSDSSQEYAVIGLGQFGISVAQNLVRLGHTVLAIDRDRDLVQDWADELTQTVALDATDETALRAVGLDAFDTVVVAIGADFESSVMITMLLKELGVRRVVCKALSQRQRAVLERVGADQVVQPEYEAGLRLAQRLSAPDLIDRLDRPDRPLWRERAADARRPPADGAARGRGGAGRRHAAAAGLG
jgi:trk system potassium uptake protein TrkA